MKTEQKATNGTLPWKWLVLIFLVIAATALLWLGPYVPPPPPPPEALPASRPMETPLVQVTSEAPPKAEAPLDGPAALAEKLGIEIKALHVGVDNTRLMLRYLVLDSERASGLTNWINQAKLLDSTGQNLLLPISPRPAPIRRWSGQLLRTNRVYTHFFPNPGRSVKPGDKVTLVIGNLRAENLEVQ